MSEIKTWGQRIEHSRILCPGFPVNEDYAMQSEIDDLRAALEKVERELAALRAQEPVEWRLGSRVYDSLKDAEWDWRHGETFSNTGYVPEPLFAAAGAAPVPDVDAKNLAFLSEAYDYGQFADDFNQPLVKPVRRAVRQLLGELLSASPRSHHENLSNNPTTTSIPRY